ncbi:response regulator [uncultured Jatrophihabitans sp.]|uniref:response regulator n=1 Tax=uncultured Jatrophihabitans sp. TaxID=1610747 RepID=UPI0035CAF26B
MISVLVVDDEPHLLRMLVLNLGSRGYLVTSATTGRGALEQLNGTPPDLMVLDLGLPDMDGTEVITWAHERLPRMPVVVLSARTGSQDKVTAFDLGAADYVTKPFDVNELVARLRAAARGAHLTEPDAPVQLGEFSVDLAARVIRRGSEPVHLTPTEWRMLEVLLRRPGGLVTPTELLISMRGDAEHTERSYLRIYVQQLRRKLERDPGRPRYLITEPGLGYRFVP